ncbi:Hypothetical predicted protein [Pelobates cultripes]|uniref:Uncharacterized protein n=1 Tax=Pelobates cultripes TaxID=61616 RepID=A0AAD1TAP0_PELCU|nr:Hypothetical predicted protein [Pelobates cultripes]
MHTITDQVYTSTPELCLLKKLPDNLSKSTEIILTHLLASSTSGLARYWKSDTISSMTEVLRNVFEAKSDGDVMAPKKAAKAGKRKKEMILLEDKKEIIRKHEGGM